MHGLLTELARRHDVTALSLVDGDFDAKACERAMKEYCREVVLVDNPRGGNGAAKRVQQLRSLASMHSFERRQFAAPGLQAALDRLLERTRFDVVNLEFHFSAHYALRKSPPGTKPPKVVLDTHEVAYDLARQMAASGGSLPRRLYGSLNWRKLRREELAAFRGSDGLCVCSVEDERRIHAEIPAARVVLIPNAADVVHYQPRDSDPKPDGRTVVFFGLLSTFPNIDGVTFLLREIWPRVAAARPSARCKIVGARPPQAIRDLAGPGVEITGFVEDLRPSLASAAAIVVPLRVGSGTRLKIVEGMAMGKAIVSTTLGAEGIDATPEKDILIADDPAAFAAAVIRLLDEPRLGATIGEAARTLAVARYSWSAAAASLEGFFDQVLGGTGGST